MCETRINTRNEWLAAKEIFCILSLSSNVKIITRVGWFCTHFKTVLRPRDIFKRLAISIQTLAIMFFLDKSRFSVSINLKP